MKILLASGCSWTDTNYNSSQHPGEIFDFPKWPELLAKKLGMKALNVGLCGAGFEYIYQSLIQNINTKDIGLVIAGWTKASRRDYRNSGYRVKRVGNKTTTYYQKWGNMQWDTHGDNRYFIDRMMMYIYSFQQVCKSLGIKYKQVQMIGSHETATSYPNYETWPVAIGKVLGREEHYEYMTKNPLYNKIDEEHFIGWPGTKLLGGISMKSMLDSEDDNFISKLDRHPNKKGQEKIADYLYRVINK